MDDSTPSETRQPEPVVHVVAAREGGAHKARGYGRGRPNRRSYAFEVAPDGAEVTPRSFKGYTLGAYAPNNLATYSPTNITSLHRPAVGSYSLFDEIELQSVGSLDQNGRNRNVEIKDEDGLSICGLSVFGPISPFFGALSLRHVGWSSYLLDNTLLIQRIFVIVFSFATAVIGLIYGVTNNDYFLPFYSSFALLVFTRFFILTVRFKDLRTDRDAVNTLRKPYSYVMGTEFIFPQLTFYRADAIFYQAAITVQSFAVTIHLLALSGWKLAAAITRVTPNELKSASSIMAIILAFLLLFDPILTPVPFRLAYVIPCALFVSSVSAITVHLSPDGQLAALSIATSLGISCALGFIITLYARIIYVILHRNRILFALNSHSHVSSHRPDIAIRANQC